MASSVTCIDSLVWTYTSFGNQACGGPVGFIAYSTSINVELFIKKIEEHRIGEQEFNKKWGIISTCSIPPQPNGIICKDGNPVFEY